ncbi:MAG: exo-alpha-sialidase [Acidobacteria bacterium]|nr:exo-alpha-sialidase [Acidobacteriota bacterium]
MTRTHVIRFAIASAAALGAALSLPVVMKGETTRVNGIVVIPVDEDTAAIDGDAEGDATVKGIGVFSTGGQMKQRFLKAVHAGIVPKKDHGNAGLRTRDAGDDQDDVRNTQANDPALDHITTFDPAVVSTRPFEFATQSETSAVSDGRHIVVGYNTSAGAEVQFIPGFGLAFTRLLLSGVSTSHDGGRTWTSGFVPPISPDLPFTFGDPTLATDRRGNIFYASLGTDATGDHGGIIVNKSTDHGSTFGAATVVAVDDGSDKEWMAIGPDPTAPSRDNIYITWTSFVADANGNTVGGELWLARSIDGGRTFTSRRLFAPVDDGAQSAFIQFSNPVVDSSTGRLYIPFLHFSNTDADNVRVLASDDGGVTFRRLAFNVAGAVDAFAYPNVTPGILNDCAGGGIRNALVAGLDQGGGRFGLPRFAQATRLVTQPNAAAVRNAFAFVVNSSTSPFFGVGTGSEINVVVSRDGGTTWTTAKVAASSLADPQHVHPAIDLSADAKRLTVSYYVQQLNAQLRTDVAVLKLDGRRARIDHTGPLSSTAFDLTPSNVRTPTGTTNFDRLIAPCYDIGEYQTLAHSRGEDERVFAAWGDNRKTWLSPAGSPAAGLHAQADVFTAFVGGEDR